MTGRIFAALLFAPLVGLAGPAAAIEAGPLVDAEWLSQNACGDGVAVLDIRDSARRFERAHVPCSIHSGYGADDWRVERDDVPGMLPEPAALAALIGGLGIGDADHVVVVGEGGSAGAQTAATRVYWTFKVAGHDGVSLLDGGFSAYMDAGKETESGAPAARGKKDFTVSLRPELIAGADDVAAAAARGARLIDNRESDYYVGINKSGIAARGGTLPGADNVPISWLTTPDGRFQPKAVLDQIAAETSLAASGPEITFCNSGQMGSLGWFVGHELLGNAEVSLYDGSMADWTKDAARPVEQRIKTE